MSANRGRIEATLAAFEQTLGVRLTVIDNNGLFRDRHGRALLGDGRQSHKANAVCAHGHGPRCIDHCRHAINRRGEDERKPFVHACWKGLTEVATPLIFKGVHVGSLFAGIWRDGKAPPRELPPAFHTAYAALDALPRSRARALLRMLPWIGEGLQTALDAELGTAMAATDMKTRIRRFLVFHCHRQTGVDELAEALHLSPSRARHVVKETCGRSFGQLLLEERLRRACGMLRHSDRPVGEIAASVGLPDQRYFAKRFKAAYGVTPSAYRRRDKG